MDTIPQDDSQRKDTPKTTFIYVLIDPETNEIRYVGKADNLRRRYNKHLRETDDTYKNRWIRDLLSRGLKPIIQAIEEPAYDLWPSRERYWIAFYRAQGCLLTNTAEGGKGGNPSPEIKAKISASLTDKKRPPEFHEKMREVMASKKGVKRPPEVGAKVTAAKTGQKRKPFSEEWKQNIGNGHRGMKRSPEACARIAASKRGKKASPETRAILSAAQKKRITMKNKPPEQPTLWEQSAYDR